MHGKREMRREHPPFAIFLALLVPAALLMLAILWRLQRPTESAATDWPTSLPETPLEPEISSEPETSSAISPSQAEDAASEPSPFVISFLGDCTLTSSHYAGHFEKQVGDDFAYPFSNVSRILQADDLTLANLECSFSDSRLDSSSEYAFCGDPKYIQSLVLGGVEAVTMSNNHTGDFGAAGIQDTAAALAENDICDISGNQSVCFDLQHSDGSSLRVGAYVHPFNGSAQQMEAGCARLAADGADIIIAFMHAGAEKSYTPTKRQQLLAHAAVKGGADVVVGTHPHVLQPEETYQDSVILYSIGNFCFGGNRNPSDKDTVIAQMTVTVTGEDLSWEISYVPCSVSSVSDRNDYRPTPYQTDTDAYRRCLQKLAGTYQPPESDPVSADPALSANP